MSIADQPDAAPEPDVTNVLNGAATYIAVNGLHKGEFFDEDYTAACALGAIALSDAEYRNGICQTETVAGEPATRALLSYLIDQPQTAAHIGPYIRFTAEAIGVEDGIWLEDRLVNPIETIGGWNDAPERTAEQVVETLRSAARWAGAR